jgi:hypothetical protein
MFGQINPGHKYLTDFWNIHFNIILSPTPRSSKLCSQDYVANIMTSLRSRQIQVRIPAGTEDFYFSLIQIAQTAAETQSTSYSMDTEFLPGGKVAVPWGWHSSTFSAEVNNECRYTATRLTWLCGKHGQLYRLSSVVIKFGRKSVPLQEIAALYFMHTNAQLQYTVWTKLTGKCKKGKRKVDPRIGHEGPEEE